MPLARVAARSLSCLCPSLVCLSTISAFSFPLSEELSPISLRAPSLDSVCVSDSERTISAASGDDGGGRRGGGGGASERKL